jgi:hypothetical protein
MSENKEKTQNATIIAAIITAIASIIIAIISGYFNLQSVERAKQAQSTSEILAQIGTQDIGTKVSLQETVSGPTSTLYPTQTLLPTYTFLPTHTSQSTQTPQSTYTPQPTYTLIPLPTETSTPSITLPFSDNFDTGIKPEWRQIVGTWIMTKGELTLGNVAGSSTGGKGIIFVGDKNWSDYTVSLKIDHHGAGWNNFNYVIVRAQDTKNFIALRFGDVVNYSAAHNAFWYTVKDGNWILIPNTTFSDWYFDRPFEVKIIVKGDVIESYINGQQSSFFSGLAFTKGLIGIGIETSVADRTVSFDDFLVEP